MPQPAMLSNETEAAAYLARATTWRTLFLWEACVINEAEAARRLNLDPASADWLRRIALREEQAERTTNTKRKR